MLSYVQKIGFETNENSYQIFELTVSQRSVLRYFKLVLSKSFYDNVIYYYTEIVTETIEWVETEIDVIEIEILDVEEAAIERETIEEVVTEIVAIGILVQNSKFETFIFYSFTIM